MIFPDLQSFLNHLEGLGELKRVTVEVDPELEVTEITTRVIKENGPALFFERPKGTSYPLVMNLLGSEKRIEIALGRHPQEIGQEIASLVEKLNPPSLKGLFSVRGTLIKALSMRTTEAQNPTCQEVVEEPDLDRLPILKCWPKDGGRFITFPLVITHDPLTGKRNVGIYRMQVFAKDKTGMHWQIQKGGAFHSFAAEEENRTLEVAVVIGADPVLLLSAVAPLPEGFDEIAFSGFLRGKPTPMIKATTLDLNVPASAEFVLEGEVSPHHRQMEGPFGDHFGHYSNPAPFPVFQIKKITRRRKPVYLATVVGKPPHEDKYLGNAVQQVLSPLIRLIHPEIRDMWSYFETGFHSLLVVSVVERYHKEGVKTALALMGTGQMSLTKCVVLVDRDVDVRDFSVVLREIRTEFEPSEDFTLILSAPFDTLDFTSFKMNLGSKMILDATRKGVPHTPDQRLREKVSNLGEMDRRIIEWRLLEETMLVVKVKEGGREIVEKLVKTRELEGIKIVAAVSPDVNLQDREEILWGVFTRFDPVRDICFTEMKLEGAWPVYRGCMGIDATLKEGYPEPLEMTEEIKEKVSRRWNEYWT